MAPSDKRNPQTGTGDATPGGATGRRRGKAATRDAILAAARDAFATAGYDRATLRGIAHAAHVDPALVIHYFGSKKGLFAIALQLPVSPGDIITALLSSEDPSAHDHLGETIVRTFLSAWEPPTSRPQLVAMVRSGLTNDVAQAMIRDTLGAQIFQPVTAALGVPDGELRATLIGSQLVGLAIMRYIIFIEPIASATPEHLVAAVGPTIQHYLLDDLTGYEHPSPPPTALRPSPRQTVADGLLDLDEEKGDHAERQNR